MQSQRIELTSIVFDRIVEKEGMKNRGIMHFRPKINFTQLQESGCGLTVFLPKHVPGQTSFYIDFGVLGPALAYSGTVQITRKGYRVLLPVPLISPFSDQISAGTVSLPQAGRGIKVRFGVLPAAA